MGDRHDGLHASARRGEKPADYIDVDHSTVLPTPTDTTAQSTPPAMTDTTDEIASATIEKADEKATDENLVVEEPTCEEDYITWFNKYGHPFIQNPERWVGPKVEEAGPSAGPSSSMPSVIVTSPSATLWEKNLPLLKDVYHKMVMGLDKLEGKRLGSPYKLLCEARDVVGKIVEAADNDDEDNDAYKVQPRDQSKKRKPNQEEEPVESGHVKRHGIRTKSTLKRPKNGRFAAQDQE